MAVLGMGSGKAEAQDLWSQIASPHSYSDRTQE